MTEKLEVVRHKNGNLKNICETESYTNYENEADDGKEVSLSVGAFASFDETGNVRKIGQYGTECLQGTISNPGRFIWQSSLVWSKEFDANGKVIKTFGKEGKFELPSEMQEILKKEKLLPAVNKALSAKKKPALKSTLSRGTKSPRKKAGKEM